MLNITIHGCGKPLVLLHGWGFDSQIWQSIQSDLSHRYQLYLVDLPGFGLSPVMDWDAFKLAILNQLPTNFALAGWSMGGLFATRLSIEAPTRVSHLLNIATSPCFVEDEEWPGVTRLAFKSFYENLAMSPERTLNDFVQLQRQGNRLPGNQSASQPTLAGLRHGLDALFNWDLRQALFKLKVPTCYLFGRLDSITPHKLMKKMEVMYPAFEYVLLNKAAHMPFLSHPEAFIETVERFVV